MAVAAVAAAPAAPAPKALVSPRLSVTAAVCDARRRRTSAGVSFSRTANPRRPRARAIEAARLAVRLAASRIVTVSGDAKHNSKDTVVARLVAVDGCPNWDRHHR